MRFTPHNYQKRAIQWVEDHAKSLLFLDMGLGKSVITLTAIQNMIWRFEIERVLVIAPKKVAESTWASEVAKWDHLDLRVSVVLGDEKSRVRALAADADIYVTSRDMVAWMNVYYKGRAPFDCLVIDELSSFKNPKSLRFKALRQMSCHIGRRIGLTGTPAPNGLLDLWAQVYCIDFGERLGGSLTRFREFYFTTVGRNGIIYRADPKPGTSGALRRRISDIALTMRAEDWLELPELIENEVRVNLPEEVMEMYKDFERHRIMECKDSEGNIIAGSEAGLISKLSQFANGAVYDEYRVVWPYHEEKIDALEEIVESSGSPVLCFYQFRHDVERIMKRMEYAREYKGNEDLGDWNAGKIRLMLAHPSSTAYGLNMQEGGHTVVWFSTGWNLELYLQANARLHRQGQRERVIVHKLISRGTIDERMNGALRSKDKTQSAFLDEMKKYIKDYK